MPGIETILVVLAVILILAVSFVVLIFLAFVALTSSLVTRSIKYFSVDKSTMGYRHQVVQEQEDKKRIMESLQRQIDSPT